MKKILNILIIFLLFGFINVNAKECNASEIARLNEAANKVKVSYDVVQTKKTKEADFLDMDGKPVEGTYEVTEDSLKITVYGISDDLFIMMTNDADGEKVIINNENATNGSYSFINENINDLVNYTFEIYSNYSNCDTALLKTVNFTKPFLNPNALYDVCVENPTVPVCQRYITKLFDVQDGALADVVKKYLNGDQNEEEDPTVKEKNNKKNDYLLYGVIGGSVILVAIATYVVISKKRGALK